MTAHPAVEAALEERRAFADLSHWRKIHVHGAEAAGWLNDLLTADLSGLRPEISQRTLLLTATGRVRADVHATPFEDGFLLLQAPDQPDPIDGLLSRYVLSSDVALDDRTAALGLVAFPGREPPGTADGLAIRPSVLGEGADLLVEPTLLEDIRAVAEGLSLTEADPEALEAWRIRAGIPRFPADLSTESLPHETPLGDAIAYEKGCYLGQEAVAKVRNLGHPPFLVVAGEVGAASVPGDQVMAGTQEAGVVTSAAVARDGTTAVVVRVRWAARDASLALRDGSPIRIRRSTPA